MIRPDSRFLKMAVALAVGACMLATQASAALIDLTPQNGAANSAGSVSLADLISGQAMGVQVGDKEFTGFSYSATGDMPASANINVLGFQDVDGNWGISFHGSFLDLPGGASSDALIRFMVEVSDAAQAQGWRITDAHLAIAGAGVAGDESLFLVDETLSNGQLLEAYVTTLGPGPQVNKLTDSKVFAPVTKLNVTKDILAIAAAGTFLPSRATVIDQSFSQEQIVPEPATAALLGLSSLAFVSVSRRRS
jgi:hypothetical protein